jgi:hypothetical protein
VVYLYATHELVATAWAATCPGITADMVDTVLPRDAASWATKGFVTVTVAGGSSEVNFRLGAPVITYQCWANQPGTDQPPWGKARNLAESIRAGTYVSQEIALTLPADEHATVYTTYAVGEPRRVYGDNGDWAAYTLDVLLNWSPFLPSTP